MDIDIELIKPSPYQPRLDFDLEDLRGSVIKDGILVPLTVRQKDDYYELIDGERRLKLAKELGYKTVVCEEVKADNDTADRMVWKVNTLRRDYKPKEKALHYERHQSQGMSLRGIARDHDDDPNNVLALLNVLKLPERYQDEVWAGCLSVGHIRKLEFQFAEGVAMATILSNLDIAIERRLSVQEFDDFLHPQRAKTQAQRIEAAQKAAKNLIAEPVKLETPEDYEKAAQALQEEAKRRAEEAMTPEEKVALEAEKKARAEAQALAKAEREEEKRQRRAEEERRRQERSEKKARAELKGDKTFVQEALKAMPEEEVVEMLDMVPIPGKAKKAKSLEEEFDQIMKMASKVVDNLDKLKREGKLEQLNLKRFSITLRILADSLDDFAKLAEGRSLRKEARF